jgi:hypothetical protein
MRRSASQTRVKGKATGEDGRVQSGLLGADQSTFERSPRGSIFHVTDTSEGPPPMPEDPENAMMFRCFGCECNLNLSPDCHARKCF